MKLSIIIVNYNTPELVAQVIASIKSTASFQAYEIIVVNNGDADKHYVSRCKSVRFVSTENRGFGNASNAGANVAAGEYILFLNPDTLMHENTLKSSLTYIEQNNDIGILGVCSRLPQGTLDHGCKRGFPTPFASLCYITRLDRIFPQSRKIGAYRQTFISEDSINDVDCVSGAYMLMPRDVFQSIGGFDESFFLYGEDIDLCYRVKQASYRVTYYGRVSITHFKGQSGLHTNSPTALNHFYDGMRIFYDKHYHIKYNAFITRIIYMGIEIMRKRALRRLGKEIIMNLRP